MNIDVLRSFVAVAELGSLNKAAERLRVSQSTLTRQMQGLEHELGGKLVERSHAGVALTAAGHTLFDGARPLLERLDALVGETRRRARGQSGSLRLGYLMSAAAEFLTPALAEVRRQHPEVKVKLFDLAPGEQCAALRRGELDAAIIGNPDASLSREFFLKRIASLPVAVAMPETHPLSERREIALAELRNEMFVGAKDEDMPGYNRWLIQLCRRARFRPRFVENADGLFHALSLLVAENAVTLLPAPATNSSPGVVFRPLRERAARWDLVIAWQRGKTTDAVLVLVQALTRNGGRGRTAAAKSPA